MWKSFKEGFWRGWHRVRDEVREVSKPIDATSILLDQITESLKKSTEGVERCTEIIRDINRTLDVPTTAVHPTLLYFGDEGHRWFTVRTQEGWEFECELPDTIHLPNTLPVFENMTFAMRVDLVVKYPPKKNVS